MDNYNFFKLYSRFLADVSVFFIYIIYRTQLLINLFSRRRHRHTLTIPKSAGLIKSLAVVMMLMLLPQSTYADNNSINGTCPGEIVEEMNNATGDVSHVENGRIGGNGNDRYRMTFTVGGTLDISATNREPSRNARYKFYVSRNSCGNNDSDWNIVSAELARSHSTSVAVNAGDVIYIRLQAVDSEPVSGRHGYALALDFTASVVPPNVCSGTNGLTGDYYNNNNFIAPVALSRVDANIDFAWGGGSPDPSINNDNFSIVWSGTIYFPESADYIFSLAHDDKLRLVIDGSTVYDGTSWTGGSNNYVDAASQHFDAGTYPIEMRFVEWGGGAYAKLAWRNNASIGSRTIVPSVDFCTHFVAPVVATDDSYTTAIDTTLTENVLTNDVGTSIVVTANTQPANGSVTMQPNGTFLYTPNMGFTGSDTFTYTISDGATSATATVTILVTDVTDYESGIQPFVLINPPSTRNIIGDYVILGNTIECITNKRGTSSESNSYSGTCQDSNAYNDNNYMAKYLDIDGNSGIGSNTWNSSSSNFTLPPSYDQQGGDGILWAGIFWQGSINNAESYKQRRAYLDASGNIAYKYITSDEDIDLEDTPGNRLLLRVDGDTSYTPIQATTFYYDTAHGDEGGYYAAYRDITQLLRDRNLAAGDHTITVANITANEGRQQGTGNYAGWSIVVIYKEDDLNGEPRNISIYNGYTVIPSSRQVTISGFKLPKTGTVRAKFSAFAGEGEYIYGSASNRYDRMVMKRLPSDTGNTMPGAADPDNIFDAILANIDRDSANDNDVVNANGIDVESYDVSSIITGYRNIDEDIDTIYIGLSSNQDYVTPSMMAFSTELYKPGLCYDYTYDIGGYVLTSENNEVNTSYHHLNPVLTTHVSIRSLEGDFQLQNSRFTVLSNPEYMTFRSGSAALAPNLIYGYSPAAAYNIDNPQASSFTMDIGDNIVSGSGGTIEAYQTTYTRFQHDMNISKSIINTSLTMKVTYTVDYGSGPVPQAQQLDAAAYCNGSGLYEPVFGKFNIVGDGADSDEYNLVSQVSSRPYNVKAYGYDVDNTTVKSFDTAIEVEIFNANFFENDTKLSCNNPDSNVTSPIFVQFNNVPSVDITSQQYNVAKRNAGYRVWYLEKLDGSIVEHHCNDRNDGACFQGVYGTNYGGDTLCSTECSGGPGCYSCLRKFYGKPVCSRDNFSIRPETYVMTMTDGATIIGRNNTLTPYSLAARNNYTMSVDAVAFNATSPAANIPARGYVKAFGTNSPYATSINPNTYDGATMMNGFSGNTNCNDLNSEDFKFTFWQGQASNSAMATRNVGRYQFHILDTTWTTVDQIPNSQGDIGCIVDNAGIPVNGLIGCNISSDYNSSTINSRYEDFPIIARPFRFNTSNLAYNTQAANNNYVYSNTLGFAPGVDNNMSITLTGDIIAEGADGNQLSNFVTGCYDTNISMIYNSVSVPAVPTDINGNPLALRWYERLASDIPGGNVGTSQLVSVQPVTLIQGQNFPKARQGRSLVDLRVDYDRATNVPHNPFTITTTSLTTDCNVTALCTMNANGVSNYTPNTTQLFGNTATVLYSRVNAPRKRVMCDSSSGSCNGSMLFFYEFYADQNADQNPATRALVTAILPDSIRQRSIDGANWYRNYYHNAPADGQVSGTSQSTSVIGGASVFNNGVQTINYTYTGARGYPYKDTVTATAPAGVEPWLVYDPYIPAATQVKGQLEFYGPGSWSSSTGQKASTGSKKKTNRRIRW